MQIEANKVTGEKEGKKKATSLILTECPEYCSVWNITSKIEAD